VRLPFSNVKDRVGRFIEWLGENMTKGFIRQSSSPSATPILCAKKLDGELQCCIDYQDINSKTIKNRYPLPLVKETLNLLVEYQVYTKFHVQGASNLLWVQEGDEHTLAFQTRYGLYEPMVMQFGTTNSPVVFKGYTNYAIREALDEFASAYLDDVLIYGNLEEEREVHVKWIMQRLLEARFYLKPEKCESHKHIMKYSGLIISTKGITIDEDEVETV